MRIIAFEASAVGNWIVKSPELDVLSPPKASAHTAGSPDAESLKINAPFAVILLELNVKSFKSVIAVVQSLLGSMRVSAAPLAV